MNDRRVNIKIAAGEPVQIKGIPHTIIEVIDLKSVLLKTIILAGKVSRLSVN